MKKLVLSTLIAATFASSAMASDYTMSKAAAGGWKMKDANGLVMRVAEDGSVWNKGVQVGTATMGENDVVNVTYSNGDHNVVSQFSVNGEGKVTAPTDTIIDRPQGNPLQPLPQDQLELPTPIDSDTVIGFEGKLPGESDFEGDLPGQTNRPLETGGSHTDIENPKPSPETEGPKLPNVGDINNPLEAGNDLGNQDAINDSQQNQIDNNHAVNQSQQNQIDKNQSVNQAQDTSIDELYETTAVNADGIAVNKAGIAQNKADIGKLFSEVDRLDDRIDGTQASLHAVTNARPYLSGEGKTAVGVGLGHAGDVSAIAVGAAHALTNQWSVSATMNATTGDNSDFSFGAGTQYEF